MAQLTGYKTNSTITKYRVEFFQPDEGSKSGLVGTWLEGVTDSNKNFIISYAKKELKETTQGLTAFRIIKVIIKTTVKNTEILFLKKENL